MSHNSYNVAQGLTYQADHDIAGNWKWKMEMVKSSLKCALLARVKSLFSGHLLKTTFFHLLTKTTSVQRPHRNIGSQRWLRHTDLIRPPHVTGPDLATLRLPKNCQKRQFCEPSLAIFRLYKLPKMAIL